MLSKVAEFDDELFERICAVIQPGDEIATLTTKRPNRIITVDRSGVSVETLRSEARGSGPQYVPAWMIMTAWTHLRIHSTLRHDILLNELNVKRSAFVIALLSQFPDVVIRSTRPTVLELVETAI